MVGAQQELAVTVNGLDPGQRLEEVNMERPVLGASEGLHLIGFQLVVMEQYGVQC